MESVAQDGGQLGASLDAESTLHGEAREVCRKLRKRSGPRCDGERRRRLCIQLAAVAHVPTRGHTPRHLPIPRSGSGQRWRGSSVRRRRSERRPRGGGNHSDGDEGGQTAMLRGAMGHRRRVTAPPPAHRAASRTMSEVVPDCAPLGPSEDEGEMQGRCRGLESDGAAMTRGRAGGRALRPGTRNVVYSARNPASPSRCWHHSRPQQNSARFQ